MTTVPFCYPVCLACRTGPCPKAFTPKKPKKKLFWAPNRLPAEKMTCGHVIIPWPLFQSFPGNTMVVFCDICGEDVHPVPSPTPAQLAAKRKADQDEIPGF